MMADYLLALWFFIIGIHLTLFYLNFSENNITTPYLLGLEIPLPLIHGPMLYVYVLTLTQQNNRRYLRILHFIPPLVVYLILWDFYLLSTKDKILIYHNGGMRYQNIRENINILIYISGITYIILSIRSLKKYKDSIAKQYSNIERINLNWVYYLIFGIAVIWILVILKDDRITFTSVVIFILLAAYFGITKAGILNLPEPKIKDTEKDDTTPPNENQQIKYQKSILNEASIQEIYTRLTSKMQSEQLFKDPEINLATLAGSIEVHPNTLSQVINTIEDKNFYDYINIQRIEEFKRIAILPENQKFTILSLAFECGFNSKTAFNRNFKKYMNCSPRDFLKEQNLEIGG
ncbi:helix-turn-helix domain-containing protein [Chryseobacterium sp. B21-037]|uniref:AraC family transcriptional regulator n=2 Tax=Chryseobacterium TaxID=59732 RepID=UPI0023586F7C|nr:MULTISPECIES: helix-turn-helix domain-containing protein [unclassified Chryseobacterium]MDC8103604.1 helix-turn-helix domain-containing protein [Chryseobacterium sp. B21-037]MDQ1803209.1 helix-turn-helix domain-containing protein [Chryseobacterium sp. CKR4-1]